MLATPGRAAVRRYGRHQPAASLLVPPVASGNAYKAVSSDGLDLKRHAHLGRSLGARGARIRLAARSHSTRSRLAVCCVRARTPLAVASRAAARESLASRERRARASRAIIALIDSGGCGDGE
jgi:hypothetical protein